jgi:transposase-like protein
MTTELKPFYYKFPTQAECIAYLEKIRWDNTPVCPKCRSTKYSPVKDKNAYHCNFCNRPFTVTTKTIFHKSKVDLQKWFYAISVMMKPEENITARDLAKKIEVTKDTAWAIQNKLKNALVSSPQLLFSIDNDLNKTLCRTTK